MSVSSSRFAKFVAAILAVALHGAAIWGFKSETVAEIEGSTGSVVSSMGSAFKDYTLGVNEAVESEDVVETVLPEPVAQEKPVETTSAETPQQSVTPEPTPVRAAEPLEPVQAQIVPEAAQPTIALTPAETPAQDRVAALEPEQQQQTPLEETEVIQAEDQPIVTSSLRPKLRKTEPEKPKKAEKKPVDTTQRKKAQQRGDSQERNSRAGSASSTSQQANQAASTGTSRTASLGNAAVSNYPGLVMKKISRVPKPRVGSKGESVVAFRISASGGLAGVSLARSSGSAKLDQAALRVIRRAAPFPPPPAGARRSFSIKIKGR